MKEFKIIQQANIIDDIMEYLTDGMMGIAMARDWDYDRKGKIKRICLNCTKIF